MSWVKIDDQFSEHPKVIQAGPLASWLYVRGLCYSAKYLTDGFISDAVAKQLSLFGENQIDIRQILVDCRLWDLVDGGYVIHDYLDYNPTAEQVRAERDIAKRRFAMNADPKLAKLLRERDGDNCRYCGKIVNWSDRKGPNGGTYDHITPIASGGKDRMENLVVCCRSCNSRKGARTPQQAGMMLLSSANQAGISTESSRNQDIPSPSPSPIIEESSLVISEKAPLIAAAPPKSKPEAKTPKAPKPPAEPPPAAIQALREIVGIYPPKQTWETLVNACKGKTKTELQAVYAEFLLRSPNKNNWTWVTEGVRSYSGKPNGKATPNGLPSPETLWGTVQAEIDRVHYSGIPELPAPILTAIEAVGGWYTVCKADPGGNIPSRLRDAYRSVIGGQP